MSGHVADQSLLEQDRGLLDPESLDVHGAPAYEVLEQPD